ncbi:MAG: DHH family phosphoesterase [Haloarculaceae archaeon]
MGSCIICGTSVDGKICSSHEEDVVFEFRGTKPSQLTPGRFYEGTVDGYADFGVFVDLSDNVTGLLHRSKLDRRLESLDWEPGDSVFVQVTNIRDNGDIDLGWSIRQSRREFRGVLVDDPAGEYEPDVDEAAESEPEPDPEPEPEPEAAEPEPEPEQEPEATADESAAAESGAGTAGEATDEATDEATGTESEPAPEPEAETPERVAVGDLRDRLGDVVRIEGEVVSVRQTSGPTVFELRDESGTVDCAAFVEAGVRAYPDVETGDVVRLDGEVRTRRDELQVETEDLVVLAGEEREAVVERMADALTERARPETVELLAEDEAIDADAIGEVATVVRRAIMESRPVVVRHPATADGYVAGAAIERAALPLVAEEHVGSDATYHYFDRRPLEGDVYDMDDATKDVTTMLDARQRHDEQFPLFVFAGAGTTADSADGLGLLDVYDAPRVVVSGDDVEAAVAETVEATVAPSPARTAGTVAANLGAAVNGDVRDDLRHLPAVSYWEDAPETYVDLATAAGVDPETTRQLREAVALEAYYQSYEDKRELIVDLLFDEHDEGDGRGLARQVSEQFRTKLDDELETAEANLERRQVDDTEVAVLDADAFTHRFDFPPADVLLDELHRRTRTEAPVTVGVADDELRIRSTNELDLGSLAERTRDRVPNAGVLARGGRIEFLTGERDAVVDAVVESVATQA